MVGGQESFLTCVPHLKRNGGWGERGTSSDRVGGVGTLGLAEGPSNVSSQSRKKAVAGAGPAMQGGRALLVRVTLSFSPVFPCAFPHSSLHSAWLVELENCRLVPHAPELFSVRMWTT